MTLVDPKLGVPYTFGGKLPSGHVNTVWAQQPNAFDAINGGTYALANPATINGALVTLQQASVGTFTASASATLGYGATIALSPARTITKNNIVPPQETQSYSGGTIVWEKYRNNGVLVPGSNFYGVVQVGTTVVPYYFPVSQFVPRVCTINSVLVSCSGAGGSAGTGGGAALPTTMPSVALWDAAGNTGGTITDASADRPAYEAFHIISAGTIGAGAHDSEGANGPWMLEIMGESVGTARSLAFFVCWVSISYTTAAIGAEQ